MSLLYVDRHFVHEGSFHAFARLAERGLRVRRPELVFGMMDHYVPTNSRAVEAAGNSKIRGVLDTFLENASTYAIKAYRLGDPNQGIVHVVAPEEGLILPGMVVTCGDSHTSTLGALGALAIGVGQTENAHVLATQTFWQRRPKQMRIHIEGRLPVGCNAKDVILFLISRLGAGAGTGHVVEYAGSTVDQMSMEARLTLCNMAVEMGARSGMVGPDETTFAYLSGKPHAPAGPLWDGALELWRNFKSDEGATFDVEHQLDVSQLAPMVTWGTSPQDAIRIDERVPDPAAEKNLNRQQAMWKALRFIGMQPGMSMEGLPVGRVFIGSCTNSRIEDLRDAAMVAARGIVKIPAWVVPGSERVKRQAEAEGLDKILKRAGFEWRSPGCSMWAALNGEIGKPHTSVLRRPLIETLRVGRARACGLIL